MRRATRTGAAATTVCCEPAVALSSRVTPHVHIVECHRVVVTREDGVHVAKRRDGDWTQLAPNSTASTTSEWERVCPLRPGELDS